MTTEEDGTFVQERLCPGLMTLEVTDGEYESVRHYITLIPGQILDLGTLRLHKALTIKGRVLDANGNGIGTSITWRNIDRMTVPQPLDVGMSTHSGADGAFTISGVGPGRYLIQLSRAHTEVVTFAADMEELVLRLPSKTGLLVLETIVQPADYLLFQIVDDGGVPVWARHVWYSWKLNYRFAPGSYTLRIFEDARLLKTIPFTIGDEPVTITAP